MQVEIIDRYHSAENKNNLSTELKEIEMIGAWLHRIGESEADYHLVLDKCLNDHSVKRYFLAHARGEYDEPNTKRSN